VQGAELMSKFGINVPPGQAAKSLEDVKKAAESMKDENNEVCCFFPIWSQ
jgi:succinyl-CoA synthetase beta subunit